MGSLGRFLRLPLSEKFLCAQAFALIPLTAMALRIAGLNPWQSLLSKFIPKHREDSSTAARAEQAFRVAHLVDAAARRLPFHANCLHQSVVLWWLLRRRGLAADLRIGSRTQGDTLEAHAWVEYAGTVLNDSSDVRLRFTPFDRSITPREAGSR